MKSSLTNPNHTANNQHILQCYETARTDVALSSDGGKQQQLELWCLINKEQGGVVLCLLVSVWQGAKRRLIHQVGPLK